MDFKWGWGAVAGAGKMRVSVERWLVSSNSDAVMHHDNDRLHQLCRPGAGCIKCYNTPRDWGSKCKILKETLNQKKYKNKMWSK